MLNIAKTKALYEKAKALIPTGTQLLSKQPELMDPERWPAYYSEAAGCEVVDLDGNRYTDMTSNGIGACLLGYNDPDVSAAVKAVIDKGNMATLNPPEEVELAEALIALHPWASLARFARCGGESMAIAVRVARATTGRSKVAICGYHGWHDWYLAANLGDSDQLKGHLLPGLNPLGVPDCLRGSAGTFNYNRFDEFERLVAASGDDLAAVVMEPCRYDLPENDFLEKVRDLAHARGALLIFDEITIGWRLARGGAHLKLGVNPDIAVFAKALGNGHPIGAVIGTPEAMRGAYDSFISSTYWTERTGPAAALAVLKKMKAVDVPAHVARIGEKFKTVIAENAAKRDVKVVVDKGFPCLAHFAFDYPNANAVRTLYTRLMLDKGFLAAAAIYPTLAHNDAIMARFSAAVDETFGRLAELIRADAVAKALNGVEAKTGFKRLN